jgi:hypothetical protein
MTKNRLAEEANYWDTTIQPGKSLAEIMEMLETFGAEGIMTVQGQAGGKFTWLIRFQWREHNYRFLFTPLICKYPLQTKSFAGKRRTHEEQARYQMGRIAVNFVKAILTAAEAQPGALFGFIELPAGDPGAIPNVASEMDISVLPRMLPLLPSNLDVQENRYGE